MTNESDIYSITGMFNEPNNSRIGIFGGWFALQDSKVSALEASLRGMLIDAHGPSEIFGTLSPHYLKFDKIYSQGRTNIAYVFDKNENGIWLGTYKFEDLEGKTVCKIEKNWENLQMIEPESVSPEQWAKDLIDDMLKRGMLKEVTNKKGKKFLVP